MCGIVGLISAFKDGFSTNEAAAFRDMLLIDTLRGFDSTGTFVVSNQGDVAICKGAMNGAKFITSDEYAGVAQAMLFDGMMAVGHNRAATRGKVVDKNAHPFNIDDKIVLVQNGTYYGDHTHHADTEVDTEAVAHVIARDGDDIEAALQKINAAYCLVWHDVEKKTLNIIRNKERPMYFAYPEEGCIMFASEPGTIIAAAMRNGLTLKKEPYMISDSYLVQYKINDDKTYEPAYRENLDIAFRAKVYPFRQQESYHSLACAYSPPPASHAKAAPTTVTHSIHYYVSRGKFTDDFATTNKAATEMAQHQGKTSYTTPRLVTWTDYLPANHDANCRSWFVYGTAMSALSDPERMLHYCLIFDKDEKEMMEMVYNEFYFVNTSTAQVHTVNATDENGHTVQRSIAAVYCSNPVKAEIILNETTTH